MTVILRASGSTLTPTAWGILTLEHSSRLPSRTTISRSTDGGDPIVSARSSPRSTSTHALEILYRTRTEAEAVIETTLSRGVPIEYLDTQRRAHRIRRAYVTSDATITDQNGSDAVRLAVTLQEIPS